ncbi:Gar1/Naf1 RNA binding region-domain-containing protein [Lactifluus subvellereus]|nr:Gar1/Naf1 RNA binding region-domain-containing protein [Lactifluus subvellereus]
MSRGGRGGFSRGGGRGYGRGGGPPRDAGPPDSVLEMGSFIHAVEDEMLCSSLMPDKVPYFNAPIYLQNKSVIGKVDEILGPINEVYFSVKMGEGMVAGSFKTGDKVYIAGDKLLPIERFLPKPKAVGGVTSTYICFNVLGYLGSCHIVASQKGAKAEAGAAGEDGVVVHQEDVGGHEVGVAAEGALEVIVVAEAQEGSVAVVVVAVEAGDSEEVVAVSEGDNIGVCVLEIEFAPPQSFHGA